MKILILGGYGTFGGRLAQLLADEERLTLIIAGRSGAKAEAFRAGLAAKATLQAAAFDRDGDVEAQLRQIAPDIVVDATGPFQAYGEDPYGVVRAALAAGVNYLDLADAAEFVEGIAQFDAEARARGLFVLSGVSSFPVLTAAVVRSLAQGWTKVTGIEAGIAPSPHAEVGLNVIRAIASYAGKPVRLWSDGEATTGCGLVDTRWYVIAPPGCVPLNELHFSLVDVPDLRLLPKVWPDLEDVWVGVAPTPAIWHRALNRLAHLVQTNRLASLSPLARPMHWAIRMLRWGEHRGGMYVAIDGEGPEGLADSWHMIAEGDDGPLIPSMAAEAIIRRCLATNTPPGGARAAIGDLELADYEMLFARRNIKTGRRNDADFTYPLPLYRALLGNAWHGMPESWRAMHPERAYAPMVAEGRADVERGTSPLARLVARMVGFPPAGRDVPVTVEFETTEGGERWTRTFAGHSFSSRQVQGWPRRYEHLLWEYFGPLCFMMALVVEGQRMRLVLRRWTVWGIPLPMALAPRSDAYEFEEGGRFNFHVAISHPLTGLIVRYRGWLVPRP